jgi:chitooligosaccharide deacetylase
MPDVVALTFDDGPDPAGTPAILAALARARARATFFVLAGRAAAQPELVAAIRAAGHAVELHGYEHLRHTDCSRERIARDTERALTTLAGLGVAPRRWRTPWGVCAAWTDALAERHGLELVHWDVDPEDWAGPTAEQMLARIAGDLRPGAVVLLHDGCGPGALRTTCAETVALVEPLVAAVRARGMEPAPLGAIAALAVV